MSTWNSNFSLGSVTAQPAWAREPSGFTLLEMMIAVAIIGIALVSVYKLHAQTIGLTAITRFNTTAALLAQSRLAQLETKPLKDASNDSGDFGKEYPGYSYKVAITDVDADMFKNPGPKLKKIEIDIALNQDEQTYKLLTYRVETE
jgi:general secretion pathway protein I